MPLKLAHPDRALHPAAAAMPPVIGSFPISDLPLFLAAYSEHC